MVATDQRSILYQYPYKNTSQYIDFEWKIDNVEEIFLNTKIGKHTESDIFNNFWCLRCAPKGWKIMYGSPDYVNLWLQLCCLPLNTSKIEVEYELFCVEANIKYSNQKSFSYAPYYKNAGWNQVKLLTQSLKGLNKLTFKCSIKVLKQYDLYGQLIQNIWYQKAKRSIFGAKGS